MSECDVDEEDLIYKINGPDTDGRAFYVTLNDDIRLQSSNDGREKNMQFIQDALCGL